MLEKCIHVNNPSVPVPVPIAGTSSSDTLHTNTNAHCTPRGRWGGLRRRPAVAKALATALSREPAPIHLIRSPLTPNSPTASPPALSRIYPPLFGFHSTFEFFLSLTSSIIPFALSTHHQHQSYKQKPKNEILI